VGAGVEAVSIAIVATRVLLAGRSLAHREKELDRAFGGYLAVIATVNLGLNVAHGFADGWTPLLIGVTLAELALGALRVPVAWLVATRNEIAMLERDALIAQDKAAADKEHERANRLEDDRIAHERQKDLMRERAALKVSQPQQPTPATSQPAAATLPKRIDPAKLKAALVANPTETLPKLAQPFGVTSSAVGKYIRDHGGRDAIING